MKKIKRITIKTRRRELVIVKGEEIFKRTDNSETTQICPRCNFPVAAQKNFDRETKTIKQLSSASEVETNDVEEQ